MFISAIILGFLLGFGFPFSVSSVRVFYPLFQILYPSSAWLLLFFFIISIASLGYGIIYFLRRSRIHAGALSAVSGTSNRVIIITTVLLTTLFAIPYAITRSRYFLPGGDTVAYVGKANQFLHFGIGWSLFYDTRPIVDIFFALITTGVGFLKLSVEASYLISSSILMLVSMTLMVASSFLTLRRNGYDKLTIIISLMMTMSSVQTFQLNGGTYANSLAFSLLYFSIYILDKLLASHRLRQMLLLSGVGIIAALTHVETFGLSILVLIFSVIAISIKSPRADANKNLGNILAVLAVELIALSPFIGLAIFDDQYFGAFSTYLGNVHQKYFAAFPGISGSPPPPMDFDRVALSSLAVQYGNVFAYAALALSFPILALRFRTERCSRSDVYTLIWSAMAIIGAVTVYVLSVYWANPSFAGLLLTRRFLYLLPLPLLYSVTVDFFRRFRR